MKDIYFALASAGLTAIALASYGVRLARRGVAQSDRTDKVQTSVLLGKGLVEMGYWAITPIARGCVKLGLSANGLTWISLATGIGTGVAFVFGMFGLATFLALLTTMGDVLDGQVARMTGKSSDVGEVLDASVDRYVEFANIAGLIVFYRASLPALLITLGALLASFMVSYSTAKAEALHVPPPRGPMRRHERGVYMIVGSFVTSLAGSALAAKYPGLPPALPQLAALALICFIGNYSAVLRFVRTAHALRGRGSSH
jgi:CDP-diacylglycerol--glycerol-3-phosphate 3-phosphatidyltransferase